MTIRLRRAGITAALALFIMGACGDDPPSATREAPPSTVGAKAPQRVVSLSPTATEMLFAIGAGAQVVAVDDQSNYPPEAPRTELSGFKPNVEAIAGHDPDLVVISDASGELKAALEKLEIEVVAAPAATTLDDSYRQIELLGDATGHRRGAGRLIERMKKRIASVVAGVPAAVKGATYYHELDPGYFTATSKTFIGSVYSLLGLKNIADPADQAGSGYPQLSAEFIIEADPDFVFLADTKCCQQSPETVAGRAGWSQMSAVRNNAVVALDDDIASRWGPRVPDFLADVAARVTAREKAA